MILRGFKDFKCVYFDTDYFFIHFYCVLFTGFWHGILGNVALVIILDLILELAIRIIMAQNLAQLDSDSEDDVSILNKQDRNVNDVPAFDLDVENLLNMTDNSAFGSVENVKFQNSSEDEESEVEPTCSIAEKYRPIVDDISDDEK